jgi:hypothetical protein
MEMISREKEQKGKRVTHHDPAPARRLLRVPYHRLHHAILPTQIEYNRAVVVQHDVRALHAERHGRRAADLHARVYIVLERGGQVLPTAPRG